MMIMNLPVRIWLLLNIVGSAKSCLPVPGTTYTTTISPVSQTFAPVVERHVTLDTLVVDPTDSDPSVVVDNVRQDEINELCKALAADFGKGAIGSYDTYLWEFHTERLNNKDTGVPGPDKMKSKFLGVTMNPTEYLPLSSGDLSGIVRTDQQTFLNIRYYEATDGLTLKACINGIDDCTPISNKGIALKDLYWRSGTFLLPQTAQNVSLLAVNEGTSIGAVGLDNIGIGDGKSDFC